LSQEHATETRLLETLYYRVCIEFGQVASTREFKLIRLIDDNSVDHYRFPSGHQLCEVFTLGGSRDARWRGKKGPSQYLLYEYVSNQDVRPKGIASFDLLTEEWRSIRRGPISIPAYYSNLSLAALNGSLVLVDCTSHVSMDLWFLMDFEKGLWVKQHSVQVNLSVRDGFRAHPLVILKNGSVVIYIGSRRLLRIYNPRTNTYTDVAEMVSRDGIGLYTGNLLSIANDAI
jgi:hypothetical protein